MVMTAVLALLLIVLLTDWLGAAAVAILSVPWFVYILLAGIVISGYKFATLAWEDRKADREWIEGEGNVFIRRMEEEKERRRRIADEGGEE